MNDLLHNEKLTEWIANATGRRNLRVVRELSGGNSNLTMLVSSDSGDMVLRTPPQATISPNAHRGIERESRVMRALEGHLKVPAVLAWCDDASITGHPFLVVEKIDGISITDQMPDAYPRDAAAINSLGEQLTDELAAMHQIDPESVGLADFGNPTDFLARNIDRWQRIREQDSVRDLPLFGELAAWMRANAPATSLSRLIHGDYHLDNTLCSPLEPKLLAVIDWELATLGDPLSDLGLFLMFWGPRTIDPPAFAHVQAVTRIDGVVSRRALAERWEQATGISIENLNFYLCFAFWRLAAIVEGAWILNTRGKVDTAYARGLEYTVPALLHEAKDAANGNW